MRFTTLLAPLALATTLCLSGGAFAATIGGVTITDTDMPAFSAKCEQLQAASTKSLAEPNDDMDSTDNMQSPADFASDDAQNLYGGLTLEQCTEGGMTTAMASDAMAAPMAADQMMIGNMAIPADQVAALTEKCVALRAAENRSLTADNNNSEDSTQNSADAASVENFDMANVTADMCVSANL